MSDTHATGGGRLRSGAPTSAVDAYVEHGRLVTAVSAFDARKAMVQAWWTAARAGEGAAMFAMTRADVDSLNRLARALARDAGRLLGPELEVGGRAFAVGDEVVALRADRRLALLNGSRGRVTALRMEEGALEIEAAHGEAVVLPRRYLEDGHLGWAYALTLHKGQGSTVDRAFLLGARLSTGRPATPA